MAGWAPRAAALLCAAALVAPPPAGAAPGERLRQFEAANPFGCIANTGVAFDGEHLLLTCLDSPQIDVVSAVDGSLALSRAIAGHNGFGAAAWDARRGRLWACDAPAGNDPPRNVTVVLVNVRTGRGERRFDTAGCHDGLAYDPTDDTLWASPDVSDTVNHYRLDGTLIASHSVTSPQPLLGGFGNSGIAVTSAALYLANGGGGSIYRVPRDFGSSTLLAMFQRRRLEDLECDGLTFRGANAIWVQGAFDRHLDAIEIPVNSCGPGASDAVRAPERVAGPELGKSVNVQRVRGVVRVRRRGSRRFLPLTRLANVAVGSTIDTRRGEIRLTSASNSRGGLQSARFFKGVFNVRQRRSARAVTELVLKGGSFRACSRAASTSRHGRRSVRRLWGRGRGRFRTRGRYSSATVRGTTWLTEDRCDGTLTRVRRGRVIVRDFARRRTVEVLPERSYLARPRK